ncbi:MAG: serine hydrolase [Bdellovibrionales bacterium]|nr:serine hydrolase [Bdellovibrionales bacterium]
MSQAQKSEGVGSKAGQFGEVQSLLNSAIQDGVFPGCVLVVGVGGHVVFKSNLGSRAFGTNEEEESHGLMTADTVFDVAALTQPLVTSLLIMRLIETGKLQLNDNVTRYVQGFGVFKKSSITIRQLLSHSSGLASGHPFYEELTKANAGAHIGIMNSRGAKDFVFNSIVRSQLKYQPDGKQVFSDLGFIMLGKIVETLTGLNLAKASQRFIFQPLGLKSSSYIDLSLLKQRGLAPVTEIIAPTEECPWRKRLLCGEVHDDNAWAMGGVAGHSGLFSSAEDLHTIARELLSVYYGQSDFISRSLLRLFWSPVPELDGVSTSAQWRLGWDSPSKENGMLESGLSPKAIGANGFTGCSLWIEPEKGIDVVLMSNRVNPSRNNKKIQSFRPQLVKAIMNAVSRSHK